VNFLDLLAVIQNFNKSGTDWAKGNFTYATGPQTTNFSDLLLVVQNFNKTLTPAAGAMVGSGGPVGIQGAFVELPEPGVGVVVVLASVFVSCRRRKAPGKQGR